MAAPFQTHRARLLDRLGEDAAAGVVASGSEILRNGDSTYRFRPDSDFHYLTGFREPESVLVCLPNRAEERTVLFLRDRDREKELWSGTRLGVEAAPEVLGVDRAFPIEELWTRLPDLLAGHRGVMYLAGRDEARDREMIAAVARARLGERLGRVVPDGWIHPSRHLHELRLFKGREELDLRRRAAAVSGDAHRAAMAAAAPGVNEAEIDALLEYTFRRSGATGPAYTSIVAGGASACILHYVHNDRPLVDGELLLIDAGAEWDFYASDVTRTLPVGGAFDDEQGALYRLVLDAQVAAIEHARPGATLASIHETAVRRLSGGLVELGLLEGPVDRVVDEEAYRRFYMHRTSHWLGLDVHDCGVHHLGGEPRVLEPGMVLTVEPGLYVAPDDETVEERWRGIGIRIEDDVLITAEGRDVLTANLQKGIEEVEAAWGGAAFAPAP